MYELDQLMNSLIDDHRGKSDVQFIVHPSIPPSLNPEDPTWREPIKFWKEISVTVNRELDKTKSLRVDKEKSNEILTKECEPELGMNTLANWWDFPVHFQSHLLKLPKILQGLNMHLKLRYLENEPGKLDPDSITESIEEVIKWMHMREDQDRSRG
jgi:hypothetical protein